MKCLVAGGAGFIGSHLVDRLIKEGHEVVVIDNLSTGKKGNLNSKAKFYKLDIRDPETSQIFSREEPEIVFHYAAQIDVRKSVEEPIEDAKINILGSLNLLENCREFKIKKVIFASSGGAIYGDADIVPTPENYPEWPLSPYGIAKLTIDKYLNYYYRVFGLLYISLRFANVYGPRQDSKGEAGVVAIFCEKMLQGKQPIVNGSGEQTRDFVYVDDVVEANTLAVGSKRVGIYNIGTAKETEINTIFRKLKNLTQARCEEIHAPQKLGEQKRSCLEFQGAERELGWKPRYNLDEGLKKTVDWFIRNNNSLSD